MAILQEIIIDQDGNVTQAALDAAIVKLAGIVNPMLFKGGITVASDFPTLALVQNGWVYRILTDVTDNDASKTNTGQSFLVDAEIAWNGTNWTDLGYGQVKSVAGKTGIVTLVKGDVDLSNVDNTSDATKLIAVKAALTLSKSFIITNPTSDADSPIWRSPNAITIKAIHVLCIGGTSITGGLDEADANGANPVAVDSDIVGTAGTNVNDDGDLTNPSIDAGDYLFWHTTSVSGVVNRVVITIDYLIN